MNPTSTRLSIATALLQDTTRQRISPHTLESTISCGNKTSSSTVLLLSKAGIKSETIVNVVANR